MKKYLVCSLLALFSYTASATDLEQYLRHTEQQIQGQIGVAIIDTQQHSQWNFNGSNHFPMMSAFKTLACANVLYDVQQHKLSLTNKIKVTKAGLINWNPITQNFVGGQMSLQSVCGAAMFMSDNYAANLVLEQIGGPQGLTEFLRTIGDKKTRLDHFEPKLNYVEKGALNDTTTPIAMMNTIKKLLTGNVLDSENKAQLQLWMTNNMVSDDLARAVLPRGWKIADRSGGGVNGSRTLTAMVWNEHQQPLFIGIFIANSKLKTLPELNRVVASISAKIFNKYNIVEPH
ncbi:class A beta-lactamase [Photobacterium kishitanii]|uniref:beta-lactamase n=1 Tax=Photobacterium kishitanii TaxID=318456 RepID=A0A0B7JCY7_9GAMM|nr:class A beta-lactamase [Photobacterium kishitanii]PSU97192.1 class A beta-lactamase [Photobacterium kishitanii]PSV01698.1 class A beta-lactamase [Photobacterium kishitanii]PSW71262.1 class A beta-lactamase [Photobacterium kishitanii]CEO39784.1 Beta-lactamase CARB-3 [Photobacterium kishitanii]